MLEKIKKNILKKNVYLTLKIKIMVLIRNIKVIAVK
jgi:hypothetical protein